MNLGFLDEILNDSTNSYEINKVVYDKNRK